MKTVHEISNNEIDQHDYYAEWRGPRACDYETWGAHSLHSLKKYLRECTNYSSFTLGARDGVVHVRGQTVLSEVTYNPRRYL